MHLRVLPPSQFLAAGPLFGVYRFDRSVIDSVLEGRQGGTIAVEQEGPGAVLIHESGDAYAVGPADDARGRLLLRDGPRELGLLNRRGLNWVCDDQGWAEQVRRVWGPAARQTPRLWFRHVDPRGVRAAEGLAGLPVDFEPRPLDVELAAQCRGKVYDELDAGWGSIAAFVRAGLGVAVIEKGPRPRVAGICASYAVGGGEAEITITTFEPYRGRGVARAAGGGFILECLRRGLRPAWTCNQANTASIRLARSLGFEPAGDYVQFQIQL